MSDNAIVKSRKDFQAVTKDHTMTILKDDGLYRHIRCQIPGSSYYHWDLITWPGHLAIAGDIESYVFARVSDMFEFFGPGPDINPHYWGQKIVTGQAPEVYSEELFRSAVVEHFMEVREPGESADLFREICRDVLAYGDQKETAHRALSEFQYRFKNGQTFDFDDWYEWNMREYSPRFLFALHAIVWGISQYHAAKKQPELANA